MQLRKILIINPYGIGDVLFTTPVISHLREAFPGAQVSYLANRRTADFLKAQPDIHQVIVYERDECVQDRRRYLALYATVKQGAFDAAFDFSLNSFFGFLALAAGIKKRIGFDFRGRGRFLTDRLPLAGYEERHAVDYYMDLLRLVDLPVQQRPLKLEVPSAEAKWAGQWIKDHGIDAAKPLIALVPGGGASWGQSASLKRWPVIQFAHLADKIIENFDAAVILMGDSKEQELCRELGAQAHFPLYSAVGETSILKMAALLKHCRAAIVNDGGPLHVAVASGVRTVSLFGPVDPRVYGPYPSQGHTVVQKDLPCQPCYRRFRMARCGHVSCLRELSVEEVYRKVQTVL